METTTLLPDHLQALERIWNRINITSSNQSASWEEDLRQVYEMGIGMQEMLQFLYGQKPGLETFLAWAASHTRYEVAASLEDAVLSDADLAHWEEQGFVVLREAVSPAEHIAANRAIWEFLEADPADEESWYQPHPEKNGLMVVFTQHEALQAVRRSPRIRKAYEQLYGTTQIYKVVDKVSFNPPQTDTYRFMGSPLHWDTSLELPIPYRLQGLLYLSDVTAEGGAFQCVPGFHQQIEQWATSLPEGINLRTHALQNLQPVPIPGKAGDFIIWHQALPHCASPNLDRQPRLVQYFTYLPDGFRDKRAWK